MSIDTGQQENTNVIIQEVNPLTIISKVGKKNKKLQAKLLQEIEKHMDKNTGDFEELRKFVLDEVNSYTRAVMRDIFGDIEFMIKG
jgi:hypothetical protein